MNAQHSTGFWCWGRSLARALVVHAGCRQAAANANNPTHHTRHHIPVAALCPPCSGGPRKCVGDQFALMEAVVALAVALKRYDFTPQPGHDPGMTTGATIHTKNGLYMIVSRRGSQGGGGAAAPAAAAAVGAA